MKNRKQLLVYAALAATALLSLLPFFKVGFTTGDDFQYFHTAHAGWQHWMSDAKIYAEGAGRFYFYITKIFYYVPYLVDSFAYTKAVQYISLLACYCMFAWFVYRVFRSRNLGLMTLLLLIVDTALTPNNHVPTIAYPFYFSFSIIIFIGALLLYLRYTERGGWWRVVLSSLLMLAAYLFYETYLIFAIIFGLIVVIRHWKSAGFVGMIRSRVFWSEVVPYVFTALLYVGCYWGYRQWLLATVAEKTFYDGAAFSLESFSIRGFFQVLWRCTREAVPGWTYYENLWLISENSQLISGHRNIIFRVLTHAPAVVWINALLQGALLWVLTRDTFKSLTLKKAIVGVGLCLVVAFSAHTLIGMATKYNLEWSSWMCGYVTTIYSIIALMLALALIIATTVRIWNNLWWQRIMRATWCGLLVVVSVLIGYTNHHISREWQRSQNRLNLIDLIGKSGYFDTLPDDAVIYTEELHNTSWVAYDICKETSDLEYYIDRRAGRHLHYVSDTASLARVPANKPLYYLHAIETKKACELLISIARVDSVRSTNPSDLTASQAEVFYYSPCKKYTVFYQSAGQWKAVPFGAEDLTKRLTQVSLEDSALNPRTIVISDMIMPN